MELESVLTYRQAKKALARTDEPSARQSSADPRTTRTQYDKKAKTRSYQEEDSVLLLNPEKRKEQIQMTWSGPYRAHEYLNDLNYVIDVVPGERMCRVMHSNMLKLYCD